METQIKTANGIYRMPLSTLHFDKRRLFISGEINMASACDFADNVMYLNDISKEPIDLFISSGGGEVQAGLLMYDIIQSSPAPIRIYCRGIAYSMAAILFASGKNGRFILPNSKVMLHEPLLSNGVGGSASSIRSISESIMEVRAKLNNILALHTGRSIEEIEDITSHDHFFTAEESVDFGLADKIVNFSDIWR